MNEKSVPREKIPWFPDVRADRCAGCGTCLKFCPHGVYALDKKKNAARVEHPYECIVGCSNCRGLCPEGAISFPGLDEITEMIRALRRESGA